MTIRFAGALAPAVLLIACSDPTPIAAPRPTVPPGANPVEAAIALGATPLAIDERGVPRLLHATAMPAAPGTTALEMARVHVERLAPAWGVAAMPALEPIAQVPVRGGTIARFSQVIDGLPVDRGELRVLVRGGGELVAASGVLISATTPRTAAQFTDDDAGAVARAVAHTYGGSFDAGVLAARRSRRGGARILAGATADIDVQLASAHQAWYPVDGTLVAAWVVEAYTSRADRSDGDLFRTVLAGDGHVLEHRSLVADASFTYRVFAETTGDLRPMDGPIADSTPHPTGTPDGSYPAYVPSSSVVVEGLNDPHGTGVPDPWLPGNRTETVGNNVEAYADFNSPSGLTFGDFRATTTAERTFDHAYDTALGPLSSPAQQMAGITSLFYVINWLHDFWYDAGFTEAAGNAQDNNYMRGGDDRDAILAEAQDNALGGSRNNANMSTPSDGLPPRMQVFLWSGTEDRALSLAPSGRTPVNDSAAFGPADFDVTANVVLVDDTVGPNVNDACEPLTAGATTGKIALVDRGACSFKTKALHVQGAGGVGMILANNVSGDSPPGMGDDSSIDNPITIGLLSVTMAEGAAIKADLLAAPVTATLHRDSGPELDGAVDATLIAHEFGHYLHHRLSLCGTRLCSAMSEGWGDFLALMLLAREGDDLTGAYPFSVYTTQSFSDDPAYFGIRRAPYSVDPAINALSYRHMAEGEALPADHPFLPFGNNSEVHNAGEVWAAALWEGYVALQQAGTSFDEVRDRMASYVVAGLLLMPPDVTPTEARDSILAAVYAASPADHDVLAAAFARRGFGSCAISPPRDSSDFVGIVEATEVRGRALIGATTLETTTRCDEDTVLDNGEAAMITVPVTNQGHAMLTGTVATVTSMTPGLRVTSGPITIGDLAPYATTQIAVEIALDPTVETALAGDLRLDITGSGGCDVPSLPILLRLNVDDVAASAAGDGFDTETSVWTPGGDDLGAWSHVREAPLDGAWLGAALGTRSDTSLVSPVLAVGTEPLTITFLHTYEFELSNGVAYDGGVVEFSTDAGATWQDIATLAAPGYTQQLDDQSGNPLAGRMGYTDTNPSFPAADTVQLDLGTQLANQQIQLRFRIGTDSGVGTPGWQIDEVAFTGLAGTPFPTQVADAAICDDGEDPDILPPEDGGCCDAGTLRGGSVALSLGVLVLVLRRRRRTSENLASMRAG